MRRLIIGAVLALAMTAPAKADFIIAESGQYEVEGIITGQVIAPIEVDGWLLSTESSSITITISGALNGTHTMHMEECFYAPCAGGSNGVPVGVLVLDDTTRILDIDITKGGGPNAFVLRGWFQDQPDMALVRIGDVPEPSTWAMLLIGFAGIGFMAYRSRNKPEYAAGT